MACSVGSYAFDLLASRPSKIYSGPSHTEPINEDLVEMYKDVRVLVLGAGGVGCEILHNLAMTGITNIHVIDMDTVDLTNLNRQFLFRNSDIGKFKAEAAANFIMKRFPHVKVTFSNERVERNPPSFFQTFNFVLLAVDTINARRWVNAMLASLVLWRPTLAGAEATQAPLSYPHFTYEPEGAIPLIDIGSEGYMCHAKTILHGRSECMDCENYFVQTKTVQVCTLESIPRRPEHCVTFIKLKVWDQEKPFGTHLNDKGVEVTVPIDGDNEAHIAWIAAKAQQRLEHFKLPGSIDFSFTQGVVKNSVPAVGFTNAIVAAVMVNEMFKLLVEWGKPARHHGQYSGSNRVHSSRLDLAWKPTCKVCVPTRHINLPFETATPADVLKALVAHPAFEAMAKKKSVRRSCDVVMKKYMNEKVLFTLVGRRAAEAALEEVGSESGMMREESSGAMMRQDSIGSTASEGDRFFDLVHEHLYTLTDAVDRPDHANDGMVRVHTTERLVKDVYGLKTMEDAEIASLFIIVFDDVKFLINWV